MDFQAQQDRNRFIVIDVMDRLAECLDDPAALDVHRDALADALPWLRLEHFDRRATNRLLAVKTVEGSWT